ncbi:MAG: LPD38 domain-containing protein [Deltaproteobacteria bacterium]|nr:LPD38 domain-containing protein [Deltaproteobacteria bacterium]
MEEKDRPVSGLTETRTMLDAGFTQEEVGQWQQSERAKMQAAGFADADINVWFGQPEPNMEPVRQLIRENLAAEDAKQTDGPRTARTMLDAIEAGLQISVSGLVARGEAPDVVMPEDAGMAQRITSNASTLAGDAPAMVVGALLGGAGGAPGGPLALATAVGGAFALPAGLRATLMDAYEKGEFTSFGDFWERTAGVLWDTSKAWITGAATGAVGGKVAQLAKPLPSVVRGAAVLGSEVTTLVTVGSALEGEVPKATDFVDAAVILVGAKGAVKGAAKLREGYKRFGVKPEQVVVDAEAKPSVSQDLASKNIEVPRAYAGEPKPPPRAEPEAKPDAEPVAAQQAVLDRISVGQPKERAYTLDRFYTQVKDDLFPIRRLVDELAEGKKLPAIEDPYKLARLTRGMFGRADQFLEYGAYRFGDYKTVGKGLRQVLDPVKSDLDGMRAYAVSRRALELQKRGIETGVPLKEAAETVKAGKKYESVFKELQDYQDSLLTFLRDSGVLSRDAFEVIKEANKDYVPLFRVMEPGESKAGAGAGMTVRNPIKGIRGSERTIVDPIESIIKNTYLYSTLAERNAAGLALVKLAEQSPKGEALVQRVKTPVKPIELTDKEVVALLKEYGVTEAQAESFTVFRANAFNPKDNQIAVFRDGKREVYEVPFEAAEAMKALDRESAPIWARILATPARTLRAGAVLTPDFMLRNVARDQLSAFIFSKNGYVPVLDAIRGVTEIAKSGETYQNWLKSGGANATLVSMDRAYLQERLFSLDAYKSAGLFERGWNVAKSPIEVLRIASELFENATRVGEFKRAGGGKGAAKVDILAAGFESREVTLDFARIGAQTRAVNMLVAFWNARVEGIDRTARAAKDNPLNFTGKAVASITLPSVLLWWANHEDPRWREIPQWQKDLFWIVMTDDTVYRVPKPFEIGVLFGTIPERLLESFFTDNPDALRRMDDAFEQVFGLSFVPTFISPIIDQFANRSMFTGNPIIPYSKERLLGEYQYNDYTTELTKAVGGLIGRIPGVVPRSLDEEAMITGGVARAITSPALLDNYIRGWTGGLGSYVVQLLDKGLRETGVLPDPVKPLATLADIPVVKAFVVRYPSATAASIQTFYDDYTARKKVFDTYMHAAEKGDMDALDRIQKIDPDLFVQLDDIVDSLGVISQSIRLVNKNPDIPAEEQRQLIDTLYFQMIELAKAGKEMLRSSAP